MRSGASPAPPATPRTTPPGRLDPARIRTRFPPEPNGYLHVGHAKSICLNFGLARDYGGVCHLRFDDTNPEKEEQEYVDAIVEMVHWLGFDWRALRRHAVEHLYYASDYFDFMYRAAEALIEAGLAYVDEQSAEEMRVNRGDFATPGTDSPFRDRSAGREPGALSRDARRPACRRRDGAAREDRHGLAQHQPARPGAVPHQARHAPQHRRPLVHLPDVHLRAPDRGRAGEHHPQHLHAGVRGPAPVLRLAARAPGRTRPAGAAAAEAVRVRAPEPDLHRHQQAQAAAAGRRRHRRRLGRPAHAHAGRHAPARLHAREPAPAGRAQRRQQGRRLDRLQRRSTSRCATTWTPRRRARWPCSTR